MKREAKKKPRKNRRLPRRGSDVAAGEVAPDAVDAAEVGQRPRLLVRLAALRGPAVILLRLTLVGVVAVGAIAVGQLIEDHVRHSTAFATTEITVEGNERLDRAEVLEAAGLRLGNNVFEVSPEAAQAALGAHPWVSRAEVTRRLPGSYFVHVEERKAVAVAILDELFLVGDDAVIFKAHGEGDPVDLPVVTGLQDEAFVEDPPLRASVLVSAVALLHDYRDVGLWRAEPIAEIHAESDTSLSLYAGEDATLVRLGRRPFRDKLRRFRQVLDRLRAQKARPAYVYLDNARRPDRVTVRLK